MKHFHTILLSCLLLLSCQVIKDNEQTIIIDKPIGESTALLVEFTGVGCVNCPTAAQEVAKLKTLYNDKLVVVAMHPATNPFTQAQPPYDYTCPASDDYYQYFNGTASTSFPTGVVNFMQFDNVFFTDYTAWGKLIAQQVNKGANASIDLQMSLSQDKTQYDLNVKVQANESTTLLLWLVESGVVGAQMMPDGSLNEQYVHNHILRQALNGVWGETVNSGESISKHYNTSDNYNIDNCSIVAVLLNSERQVIAVAEKAFNADNNPSENPDITDNPDDEKVSDSPFLLSINGIGDITADTLIEVSDVKVNPLTGKNQIELNGMIAYKGTLTVEVKRDNPDSDDQFCCGDKCINTNYETNQQLSFQLDGLNKWFTHVVFEQPAEYLIQYTFKPNNGDNPIILTIKYIQR